MDLLGTLQAGASTALENFAKQLTPNSQGQVATPALAPQAPGTVPAGSGQFTTSAVPGGNAQAPAQTFMGMPTWAPWALGGVAVLGVVYLLARK